MGKQLVLAGAGHAHMVTLQNVREFVGKGHKVTVIGPSPTHYYSGMGPGMLGGTYTPDEIRFNSQVTVERQGGVFIKDRVASIDPEGRKVRLASGEIVYYDVLSCNLGSSVGDGFGENCGCTVFGVKPIENLQEAAAFIQSRSRSHIVRVSIIGGGPSAAELAGNVVQLTSSNNLKDAEVTVFCRTGFMTRFSRKVQDASLTYLSRAGVEIRQNDAVVSVENGQVNTLKGVQKKADIVFYAQGIHPPSLFKSSGLETGPDGGLVVNSYLQTPRYAEIFGGGDCVHFQDTPLDKVGVYAVRQNPILYHNLMAALDGQPLQRFSPGGGYLLIFNLGGGYGVLEKGRLFLKGRLAFVIKDYIDRKFIRKFK